MLRFSCPRVLLAVALVACVCAADLARAGIEVSRAPPTVSAPPGSGSWWPFGGKTGELNKALIEAAQAGHVANVEALLDKGADINAGDHEQSTAVLWAAYNGHIDVVELLCQRGADLEKGNKEGNTPLIATSFTGKVDSLRALLKYGAQIENTNKNGDTALIGASFFGQYQSVKLLLANGAKLETRNKEDRAALDLAQYKKHSDVTALIEEFKAGKGLGREESAVAEVDAALSAVSGSDTSLSLPPFNAVDPIVIEEATGSVTHWSAGAVQGWLKSLTLPERSKHALSQALWKAKIDGETMLELSEIDFYGDRCVWTGLCRVPFVTAKKFLKQVRRLQEAWDASISADSE